MHYNLFRKAIVFEIVVLFVGLSVIAPNISENVQGLVGVGSLKPSTEQLGEITVSHYYSHTVFVGVGTSQNCKPCHTWNQHIYEVYVSGEYDFEYVEMIEFDHDGEILNQKANEWSNIYGIGSYPTSIFDGDYQRIVGNHPEKLSDALDACGDRTVADIAASMTVSWLGNARIQVDIVIQNNEATYYYGYIRAFITEISSRYDTYYGDPYHFGFLDYAFDKDISINPGGVYTDNIIWDGNEHEDEHGDDFGDITPDNIQVTLAAYNNNDGYVDETAMARVPGNNPPDVPRITGPTKGKPGEEYGYEFTATDINGDDVYYYIDWGDGDVEEWIGPYDSGEEVALSHIWDEQGTYTIRAKVKDVHGAESGWATLKVSMPIYQLSTYSLFLRFFERHPWTFPLLRHLLGFTVNR